MVEACRMNTCQSQASRLDPRNGHPLQSRVSLGQSGGYVEEGTSFTPKTTIPKATSIHRTAMEGEEELPLKHPATSPKATVTRFNRGVPLGSTSISGHGKETGCIAPSPTCHYFNSKLRGKRRSGLGKQETTILSRCSETNKALAAELQSTARTAQETMDALGHIL
jgi:hypothetical protein